MKETTMCIRVDDDRLLQLANEPKARVPPWHRLMQMLRHQGLLRHRMQDALLLSERLQDVARASGDWIWETDAEHRCTWVHGAAAQGPVRGAWPPRVGEMLPDSLVVDWRGAPELPLRRLHGVLERREPIVRLVTMERDADGVHYVSRSAVPLLHVDGSLRGYRGSARDVTQSLDAKVQLWRRDESLRRAKEQAEADCAAKSVLVSQVGHELRTPLNAIVGLAQLIQARQSGGEGGVVGDWIAQIARTGWHMADVLDLLMELGRAGSAGAALAREPVDASTLARDALGHVELEARSRGIGMVLEAPASVFAMADRRAVCQVLVNLLSNAVKYNRPGGMVWLRVGGDGGQVRIEVRDTGPGLTDAQVRRLFKPFERLGVLDSQVKGHGLGLAICKELVGAMGGSLTAQGVAGVGSTFVVQLPAAQAEAVEALDGADDAAASRADCRTELPAERAQPPGCVNPPRAASSPAG
jgi:signal transduction histidine kinase